MTRRKPSGLPAPAPPDYGHLFRARLLRLLDWLDQYLQNDRDLLLCFPIDRDNMERGEQYIEQIAAEREDRANLNDRWLGNEDPPAGVVLPMTIGDALDLTREGVTELAILMRDQVALGLDLFIADKLRLGVAARSEIIARRWPRPLSDLSAPAFALHCLTAILMKFPDGELWPDRMLLNEDREEPVPYVAWPPDAALLDVASWAQAGANRALAGLGDRMVERAQNGLILDVQHGSVALPMGGVAVLFLAERDVKEGQKRKVLHVDAGKDHHEFVSGLRDYPTRGPHYQAVDLPTVARRENGRLKVELFVKGAPVQLRFDFESMTDFMVDSIRGALGPEGIRHYVAWHCLLSNEGGRRGYVRYFIDDHLKALGYDERRRRDPEVRQNIVRVMETFTQLEVAIYEDSGQLRARAPLVMVRAKLEKMDGETWKLEGMELQPNPYLYNGVYDAEAKEFGRNFMIAPVELAEVSHKDFPHIHAMGLLLAQRFRWELGKGKDGWIRLQGSKLMQLGAFKNQPANPSRQWNHLRKHLDKLVEMKFLERYAWAEEASAWSLAGMCQLWPGEWIVDRVARKLIPEETPPLVDKPATGAELKAFRLARGWSQREAARHLGVTQGAIYAAERQPDKSLGHKLRESFGAQPHDLEP